MTDMDGDATPAAGGAMSAPEARRALIAWAVRSQRRSLYRRVSSWLPEEALASIKASQLRSLTSLLEGEQQKMSNRARRDKLNSRLKLYLDRLERRGNPGSILLLAQRLAEFLTSGPASPLDQLAQRAFGEVQASASTLALDNLFDDEAEVRAEFALELARQTLALLELEASRATNLAAADEQHKALWRVADTI